MMNRLFATLVVALTILLTPALTQAGYWTEFKSPEFGFRMEVPKDMKLQGAKKHGWGGLHGKMKNAEIFVVSKLGKKASVETIQAFGIALTGIPANKWKLKWARSKHQGWDWYHIVKATKGKDVVYAMYGTGPKGNYMVLVKTKQSFVNTYWPAFLRFKSSIRLG